jgi:predicted nucleotide-binding protein
VPEKTCFVIGPIGPEGSEVRRRSDRMLRYVIAPAAMDQGYTLIRADQIVAAGVITAQILKHLLEAPLAIADLSGTNPNVMYELGVRHATRRPVIQVVAAGEHLPFDVANVRTIIVDLQDLDSVQQATRQLGAMIRSVETEAERDSSPVAAALDVSSFQKLTPGSGEGVSPLVSVLKDIESRLGALEVRARTTEKDSTGPNYSRRVFVVHGHDGELKNELARLLQKLDFEPVILHERPDRGQTIISKLTGEMGDVGFAFVILTPDDLGAVSGKTADLKPRARQNVIFEHGLFVGHLSPSRVCAIRRGDVETPSDVHGVLYKTISEGNSIASIALEIVDELKAAGYVVDANRLLAK